VLYGSRLTGEIESIRFVTPDVAVVHRTGSVVEGWRQRMRRRRLSRQTMVVVRRDGRWQVTAFHNIRVRPLQPSGPLVELAGRFVRWRTDRARRKQQPVGELQVQASGARRRRQVGRRPGGDRGDRGRRGRSRRC
jgi:hypothetical protein